MGMIIQQEGFLSYDCKMKRCPFCGSEEVNVTGVLIGSAETGPRWAWDVRCRQCRAATSIHSTEAKAIEAWKGRYQENEVEQDGDRTWDFDGWLSCLDRYIREGISRFVGPDRSDSRAAGDAGADPVRGPEADRDPGT